MGPSTRPRNSTRVHKAHPPQKPQSQPLNPLLRKAANAFRKAHEHHERAEAIFKAAQAAEPVRADQRNVLDGVSVDELSGIQRKLKLVLSCSQVTGFALREQNCNLDREAADILATHVSDVLHVQILKLDRLLGREVDNDDIEEGEGGAS